MEPEAKYTIVGAAVILLVALLAGAIVWLGSSGQGAGAHLFTIYFERQSLQGLETRSAVTMRGVRVGSVTAIRLSPVRPAAVEVIVSLDPATPVRKSTSASVDRHILTGLATVRLANSTEDSPLLTEPPQGEARPVIAEGESTMQEVSDNLAQLAATADETMKRLNAALSPENQKAFAETLENLRRASQQAGATLAKVDAAMGSVGQAAGEVRSMAASVTTDTHQLATRYDTLGADATVSVREVGEAARRISADADRLTQRADALLGGDDLRASARALRSAADAVEAAAERLRDPQQVIYGPAPGALGPGEGRK
jgi:phospholipid/cholesterol/gamma-HCH transport system substrate-binding protein